MKPYERDRGIRINYIGSKPKTPFMKYLLCFIPVPVVGIIAWVLMMLKTEPIPDSWSRNKVTIFFITSVILHALLNGAFAGIITFWLIK